ncbi:hypothetical protein [Luteimonas lutimaris]|uniref:Uncharacterized protein n=1 Tax=Luteimonas lutimaris TaxID=698645 RepID=A0ABP7MRY5_9GAMM
MMMKKIHAIALVALMLPASAFAQELPNRGAQDEGLGKDTVNALSATLSSHSAVRRLLADDQITVSAMRWGPGEGTVWVYRTNEIGGKSGYQHFAVRVYMKQAAPGQVEFKTQVFCDVGSDRFLQITADRCERIKSDFAPKLVADHRQDFIAFIGGENTTPAQIRAAGGAIHDALAAMTGSPVAATGSSGKSETVPGQID